MASGLDASAEASSCRSSRAFREGEIELRRSIDGRRRSFIFGAVFVASIFRPAGSNECVTRSLTTTYDDTRMTAIYQPRLVFSSLIGSPHPRKTCYNRAAVPSFLALSNWGVQATWSMNDHKMTVLSHWAPRSK
jgi:hypothetical protein